MRKFLLISLFAGICFFSFAIKIYVANYFLANGLGSLPFVILLFLIYSHKHQYEQTFKHIFAGLIITHFILDLKSFFESKFLNNNITVTIDALYAFVFYLTFVFLFKKRGAGLYTKRKKDWLISFPIGFVSFLSFQYFFNAKIQARYEPILVLLSTFISFFIVLGLNTPLSKNRYVVLCFGLFFNFIAFSLGLLIYQIEPNVESEILMKGFFMTGFFCLLEAFYGYLDAFDKRT